MKVKSTIFLVKDAHGNCASATSEDNSATIHITNIKNEVDENLHFESEAYHLKTFCKENKLEYKVIESIKDFDELWDSTKDTN